MEFKRATIDNLDDIMVIINQAKEYFKNNNIDQWQDGYPNQETIINDINNEQSYLLIDNGEVIATCMLSNHNDPNYKEIINGSWLINNEHYFVIHRIAIKANHKGKNLGTIIIDHAINLFNDAKSIRIDTHHDNLSMQKMLSKNEFKYCGIIYLSDGNKRIAFEKLL